MSTIRSCLAAAVAIAALVALTPSPALADPSTETNTCCTTSGNCFGGGKRKYTQKQCDKLCSGVNQGASTCTGSTCTCSSKRK